MIGRCDHAGLTYHRPATGQTEAALPTGQRWLLTLHLSYGVTTSGWQLDLGLLLWATV